MRLILSCLLFVFACSIQVFAQPGAASQADISYELWRVRSQSITADLIKDSADLEPAERALLWARLAQRWWRDDRERAYAFMLKPIEMVEAVPNKENPEERQERLSTARLLLKIVAPLDQKLSARLVAILTQAAEQEAKTDQASADRLIEAATYLVSSDPKRASELGKLAFQIGRPTDVAPLLWRLRDKDAALANSLFGQALARARQPLDGQLLGSLINASFPEYYTPGFTAGRPVVTEDLRTELLKVYVSYLQFSQMNPENRGSQCSAVSSIAPLLAEYDRRLPQQAVIIKQSIKQCQALSPLAQQRVDDAARPLNTIDELLKAADDTRDMKVRTVYQFRAAMLAKETKDLDRALKVLDSMSPESREFMGESWEAYRRDWAASAALRHLESGDPYGMRLILNAVPTNLRPYAKLAFVRQLPQQRDPDTDPTLEFLNDARTDLDRNSVSDADKLNGYLGLLPLLVKYQPAEATAVLGHAITALNRVEEAKAKNASDASQEGRSFSPSGFSKNLPASLVEMNEYAVKEAVASITSPYARAQVRLELLGVCIQRMRSSKNGSPSAPPPVSKGEYE